VLIEGTDANKNLSLDVATDHVEGELMMREQNFNGNCLFLISLGQLNLERALEMAMVRED